MSYTINYLDDKKIVRIIIQGRLNFGMVEKYSTEAIKLARESDCNKFLINHTGTLPEGGIYKLHTDGDTLERFGFKSDDMIAIVIAGLKNDVHFLKTAKTNVKWSDFKYFSDIDKAYNWLMEDRIG